ncbi:cobalt ABC transporter permease [Rhodobacter maris]|uniref:Nickel transport protein n=1 Tax=Rhodobacter maris TaxID=446682 RepID=A0A285S0G0_9RHOB|nr:cobalt ABC transporter permease [Rhodobacter maris]SOB99965.1 nickel transport protein [Rhodobacter maris]
MKPFILSGLIACAALAPLPALAHKVIASVYPSGEAIEGELGFSDGTMVAGQAVNVIAPDGRVLATVTTDAEGNFSYAPSEPVALTFHADMGGGHVADVTMDQADVAKILGKAETLAAAQAELATPAAAATAAGPAPMSAAERLVEREATAEMLRDELRPLRQEIAAMKEKNDLQTVLGGIGYILGLFGLGFYLAARRSLARG